MIIQENLRISDMTTMRLGGVARFVVDVEEVADLQKASEFIKQQELPVFVMGRGANIIGRDEGFAGIILRNRITGWEILHEDEQVLRIRAFGGEDWDRLVEFCVDKGFSGIEALAKIPGTVGAAPVQNIGAYGQEICNSLREVEVMSIQTGERQILANHELDFGYRKSIFNAPENLNKYLIISVTLELNKTHLQPPFYISLQRYVDEHKVTDFSPRKIFEIVSEIRANKLPDPELTPSAGSFFKNVVLDAKKAESLKTQGVAVWKNPDGSYKVSAGWLIEHAGLSGKSFFGFRVSEKAALILINEKATSYQDLERARAEIRRIVREKFDLNLEQEPVELQ